MERYAGLVRQAASGGADGVEFPVRHRAPSRTDLDVPPRDGVDCAADLRTQRRRALVATQADVRRICLSLPKAISSADDFAFCLVVKDKPKKFAWVWKERVHPKKARVRNPEVLVVLTSSI